MKKRLLCLALVVVMAASLLAAPASAAGKPDLSEQNPYYFSMGDSIARCYHADNFPNYGYAQSTNYLNNGYGAYNAEFSYPYLIAEGLGLDHDKQANFHYPGIRAKELYYGLGGDVKLGEDGYSFSAYIDSLNAIKPEFINAAGKAKLVTVQAGSNDFLYYATSVSGVEQNPSVETVAKCVELMWKGFNDFCEYYPKIIERILDLQKQQKGTDEDVTIVLMGMYNSVGNAPLMDELYLPIGNAVALIANTMNLKYKEFARQYDQAIYVDLTGTETPLTSGENTIMDYLKATGEIPKLSYSHPTKEGYAYIAREILNKLPHETTDTVPCTYVKLDLNTKFTVEKVKLGLIPARFEQDGYKLTIHNYSILPRTLTVTGTNEDTGKEVVFVYSLLYKPLTGFEVHKLSSTNDLQKTVNGFKNSPINLARSIAGLFNIV